MKLLLVMALIAISVGCRTTEVSHRKPEFFDGSLEKILAEFEAIVVRKTTRAELEGRGWNFEGPNIQGVSGHEAMKKLFGPEFFNNGGDAKEKIDNLLRELNHYTLFIVTYEDVTIVTSRIYFSRKRAHQSGVKMAMFLAFVNDKVVYKAKNIDSIDARGSKHAFGDGFLRHLLPAASGFAVAKATD